MAVIHSFSLDERISNAIVNSAYSESQITEMYNSLWEDQKKKKKGFIVAMAILSAMMLGYGVPVLIKTIGFPDAWPYLGMVVAVVVITAVISWYLSMGKIKIKWNKLIKNYYPEIYINCKL